MGDAVEPAAIPGLGTGTIALVGVFGGVGGGEPLGERTIGRSNLLGRPLDDHHIIPALQVDSERRIRRQILPAPRLRATVEIDPPLEEDTPDRCRVRSTIGSGRADPVVLRRRQPLDYVRPRQQTLGMLRHTVITRQEWSARLWCHHRHPPTATIAPHDRGYRTNASSTVIFAAGRATAPPQSPFPELAISRVSRTEIAAARRR